MILRAALAALCIANAVPAAAAAVSRDALFTVAARHGCRIAPDEVAQIFGPEGFPAAFVRETLAELQVDGIASEDSQGRLGLPISLCPPANPAPSPRSAVLGYLRARGCAVRHSDEADMLASLEMSEPEVRAILLPLRDAGQLTISGFDATLDQTLCDATTD